MLSTNKIHHTVGNITNRKIDYTPWLLPGEILSTVNLVSSSATLLVANISIFLGKQVLFQTTGGAAGEVATLTATATTSTTETKIETLNVVVNAP